MEPAQAGEPSAGLVERTDSYAAATNPGSSVLWETLKREAGKEPAAGETPGGAGSEKKEQAGAGVHPFDRRITNPWQLWTFISFSWMNPTFKVSVAGQQGHASPWGNCSVHRLGPGDASHDLPQARPLTPNPMRCDAPRCDAMRRDTATMPRPLATARREPNGS